jgi:hypothetical protein
MSFDYECALTGVGSNSGFFGESDGMGDMPVGWTSVTFKRRQVNPDWVQLQQIKEAMVTGLINQLPEEYRVTQRSAVEMQVNASYYAMEQDMDMYYADVEDTVYLSASGDILEDINDLRLSLGLDKAPEAPPLGLFGAGFGDEDGNGDEEEEEEDDGEDTGEILKVLTDTSAPEPT